ncbi:MAG: methyltransferase domain-containing protein [Planctomycetes bacterium]|nr:methyltransferase domain-containing protein [Planctomycetota bacterium]
MMDGDTRKADYGCEPVRLAFAQTHDKAFAFVRTARPGRVLDVPCGAGAFALRLLRAGIDAHGCDINPAINQAPEVPFKQGDLTKRLPYDDESFDVVTCMDGIEHLENPYHGVREIGRLVRPGGKVFISIPNYLSIERRMKFLLTGCFTKPVTREMFAEKFGGQTFMMHLSPIGYPILKFALEQAGLRVVGLDREKVKPRQYFLWPLAAAIRLYTALWPARTRRRWWLHETSSRAIFWGGNTLLVLAEKAGQPALGHVP